MVVCQEKRQLLSEYDTATSKFAVVVTSLQSDLGTLPKDDYDSRAQSVDKARSKSEEARLALERHIGEHGC